MEVLVHGTDDARVHPEQRALRQLVRAEHSVANVIIDPLDVQLLSGILLRPEGLH